MRWARHQLNELRLPFQEEWTFLRQHPKQPLMVLLPLLVFWSGMNLTSYVTVHTPSSCDLRETSRSNALETWTFDKLMALRFPHGKARKVALVTIAEDSEPINVLTNTCESRKLMTPLVQRIDSHQPSVIAIDLSYSETSCMDGQVNQQFASALVNAEATVVVGQATHRRTDAEKQDDCLVLTKSFDFGTWSGVRGAVDKVKTGLTRLNVNASKIPLRWWVFADQSATEAGKTEDRRGFAFVAAQAAISHENALHGSKRRVDLEDDKKLKPYLNAGMQPYTSFLGDIPSWTAMDILCYDSVPDRLVADQCGDRIGHKRIEENLKNKVVVIGQRVDTDRPNADGVPRYGLDLQANYIEALLDGRYVHQFAIPLYNSDVVLPVDYIIIAGFVVLMIVFDGLVARERMTDIAAFFWLCSILAGMMLFAAVMLRAFGEFMPYLFLSFFPFLINVFGKLFFISATRIQQAVGLKAEG